jgi:NAD(P)H dehydrogenase (quinone)
MRVLWLYAHPDPRSLNGSLRDHGISVLRSHGHEVRESDLYAMDWDPVVRAADFAHDPAARLDVLEESERALNDGSLHADIRAEQEKLLWSDTLVVQFPLWWFGMPAILKGWFDRLFVQGFAQGVLDPVTGRARRYGDGGLVGRRALVITTVGANAATTGPRGIHGELDEVLFPVTHGTLWYSGMTPVAPFAVNGAVSVSDDEYADAAKRLTERLVTLPDADPIPFRHQNGGDYDNHLVLRDDHAPGETGVGIHYTRDDVHCGRTGSDTEAPR